MNTARKKPSRSPVADPWISLPEAARRLNLHRQTVIGHALAGELESQRVAGRTVLTRKSVERLAAKLAGEAAAATDAPRNSGEVMATTP